VKRSHLARPPPRSPKESVTASGAESQDLRLRRPIEVDRTHRR
jgi:hypothetical protein